MKKFLYIVLAVVLVGCDVIPPNERMIFVDTEIAETRKHVLLEFTGFRCVNCPTAEEIAQDLEEMYAGQLIVVALHPASNPFTHGMYDYTCPAADSVYKYLGGTASTPFPAGNVDMRSFMGDYFVNPSEWATMVFEAEQDTMAPNPDNAEVSYWLVEDSVLGVQAMPDGSVSTHYYHRHVLRDIQAKKTDIVAPEGSNPSQLYVVTVYADPTDKHIINANEEKYLIGNSVPNDH